MTVQELYRQYFKDGAKRTYIDVLTHLKNSLDALHGEVDAERASWSEGYRQRVLAGLLFDKKEQHSGTQIELIEDLIGEITEQMHEDTDQPDRDYSLRFEDVVYSLQQ